MKQIVLISVITLCLAARCVLSQYQTAPAYGNGYQQQRKAAPSPQNYGNDNQAQQQQSFAGGYGGDRNMMTSMQDKTDTMGDSYDLSSMLTSVGDNSQAGSGYGQSSASLGAKPRSSSSSYGATGGANSQAMAYGGKSSGNQMDSYGNKQSGSKYEEPQHPPMPFAWGYDINDGYGSSQFHKENGDESGKRTGSYGYMDAYGVYRHVDYVADENGFRATIKTNEPGTANENPADVMITMEEPPASVFEGNKMNSGGGGYGNSASDSNKNYGAGSSAKSGGGDKYGSASSNSDKYGKSGSGGANNYGASGSGGADNYGASGSGSANNYGASGSGSADNYGASGSGSAGSYGMAGAGSADNYGASGSGSAGSYGMAGAGSADNYGMSGSGSAGSYGMAGAGGGDKYGSADMSTTSGKQYGQGGAMSLMMGGIAAGQDDSAAYGGASVMMNGASQYGASSGVGASSGKSGMISGTSKKQYGLMRGAGSSSPALGSGAGQYGQMGGRSSMMTGGKYGSQAAPMITGSSGSGAYGNPSSSATMAASPKARRYNSSGNTSGAKRQNGMGGAKYGGSRATPNMADSQYESGVGSMMAAGQQQYGGSGVASAMMDGADAFGSTYASTRVQRGNNSGSKNFNAGADLSAYGGQR